MFYWRSAWPASRERLAVAAFTDRADGHSRGAWRGLNLASHVGDEPAAVEANRAALAAELQIPVPAFVTANQVHGRDVAVVDGPWPDPPPSADALVTASEDLALGVLVADCTPVLLADTEAGVVAAMHAGRPGMVAGVVPATLAAMRDLGATDIHAVVGPSVCSRCYEVPLEMRDEAAARHPVTAAVSWSGTPAMDVASGVVEQLRHAGARVSWVSGCTREEPRLYSYRRDGVTGRTAGVVLLRSAGATPATDTAEIRPAPWQAGR